MQPTKRRRHGELARVPSFGTTWGLSRPLAPSKGVGVPSWVLRGADAAPAVLDYSPTDGRYWHRGASYATRTAWLVAIGGAATGDVLNIGPYRPGGANLVTNGDFTSDVAGWSAVGTGAAVAWAAGELQLTAGGSLNCATQLIAGSEGEAYELTATARRGTTTNSLIVGAGTGSNLGNGVSSANISTTAPTLKSILYQGASKYVGLRNTSGSGTGTALMDGVSVREVVPFAGFTTAGSTLYVAFVAPTSQAATQVVISLDVATLGENTNERDRIRIERTAAGNVRLLVTHNLTEAFTVDFGAVADGSENHVCIGWTKAGGALGMTASLNGATPATKSIATGVPGVAVLRIGRSPTGETWAGAVSRVSYFAGRAPDDWVKWAASGFSATAIFADGDSYMAGANSVVLASDLQTLLARTVATSAVGGSTMTQIRDRILTRPWVKGRTLVVWDGSANSYGTVSAYLTLIDEIIAFHGTPGRIVFIPAVSPNGSNALVASTDAYTLDMQSIRDGLASRGVRTFDPTPLINAVASGAANDASAILYGLVAYSCLGDAADPKVHLTQAAMDTIRDQIASVISTNAL